METNKEQKPSLILIGNGMAGIRTLEALLKLTPDKYAITVIGEERLGNYNRIMLSPVLAGEEKVKNIILNDDDWYQSHNIQFHKGDPAVKIDRAKRTVTLKSGTELRYQRLLLATGARPFRIPVAGNDLKNILTFRDVKDVNQMIELSKQKKHALVVGGGLLGLEAANGLKAQGMEVTVAHSSDTLLNRQLDATAGQLLERTLKGKGIQFIMNARTSSFSGNTQGEVCRVHFKDGRHLDTDMVVLATGITPNIELAQSCGLQCDKGIVVGDDMQTYDPSIYAVGECVQHRGALFGLVAPLFDQAEVCANHLAEMGIGRYIPKSQATKLKITGINAFSAGNYLGDENSEQITYHDHAQGHYKKLVIEGHHLIGTVLYGDTQDGPWLFDLIQNHSDIDAIRDQLIFGKDFCLDLSKDESEVTAAA